MIILLVVDVITSHVCFGYPTKPASAMNIRDILAMLKLNVTKDPLVDSGDHHDPSYGYEPYWPGGEWKIRDPWDWYPTNLTTTPIPTICGDECSYLYAEVGEICAHRSGETHYEWAHCYPETCGQYENFMDLTKAFVTFPTFCGFLDAQCKSPDNNKWGFVHLGPCLQQQLIYKPNSISEYSMNRMKSYLSTYQAQMSKMGRSVDVF